MYLFVHCLFRYLIYFFIYFLLFFFATGAKYFLQVKSLLQEAQEGLFIAYCITGQVKLIAQQHNEVP